MATIQLVVFELDGNEYGIDTLAINGILRSKRFTIQKLPGVPNVIEGMISLRGQVSYIFNLRTKFGLHQTSIADESKFIMLNVGSRVAGCIVDEVTDIIKFDEAELQPAPVLSSGFNMKYLRGIARVDDRMIIILDPIHLFSTEESFDIESNLKTLTNQA